MHGLRAPLRILCAREYQTSIRDSVHKLLSDQVVALGFDELYDVLQTEIRGKNGTEFIFKGLRRNIAEIKSTEGIHLCWVEEAEAVSEPSWQTLTPTIREDGSEIWVTFNPALEDDPTYRRFVKEPPTDAIVRRVSWRDNPFMAPVLRQEREDLLRRDPEAEAHVWGGDPWTRSDAQVLAGKWSVAEFEPEHHWHGPYFGADWGFARDPTVLLRFWICDSRLYVEYEARGVQWDYDTTDRRWAEIPDSKRFVIRADSARPESIHEMEKRGYRIEGAPKWKGSVEDGIGHLRNYDEIIVHPRCKGMIEECRMWRYKTDPRTDDVLPKVQDGHDHGPDALRYGLAPMIRGLQGLELPASGALALGLEHDPPWRIR